MVRIEPPPHPSKYTGKLTREMNEAFNRPDAREFTRQAVEHVWYWTELKRHPLPKGITALPLWVAVKYARQGSYRHVRWTAEPGFDYAYYLPDSLQQQLHGIDHFVERVAKQGSSPVGTKAGPAQDRLILRYWNQSKIEEPISSSILEGAATTRRAAKEMLQTGRKPRTHGERMILNNDRAIRHVKTICRDTLTVEKLLELHAIVTKGTLKDSADEGRFRTTDDVVVADSTTGETVYQPPAAATLTALMADYCTFANRDEPAFMHPLVKASLLHMFMGVVHPFVDGNGRLARSLFYWYLLKHDYWLFEYASLSSAIRNAPGQYSDSYQKTELDQNDATYFLKYNLAKSKESLDRLWTYLERKIKEAEQTKEWRLALDVNDRQADALLEFAHAPHKILTVAEYQRTYGTVHQTARTDLQNLVAQGWLSSKKSGKKFIYVRADDFEHKLDKYLGKKT